VRETKAVFQSRRRTEKAGGGRCVETLIGRFTCLPIIDGFIGTTVNDHPAGQNIDWTWENRTEEPTHPWPLRALRGNDVGLYSRAQSRLWFSRIANEWRAGVQSYGNTPAVRNALANLGRPRHAFDDAGFFQLISTASPDSILENHLKFDVLRTGLT